MQVEGAALPQQQQQHGQSEGFKSKQDKGKEKPRKDKADRAGGTSKPVSDQE